MSIMAPTRHWAISDADYEFWLYQSADTAGMHFTTLGTFESRAARDDPQLAEGSSSAFFFGIFFDIIHTLRHGAAGRRNRGGS